MSLTYYLTIDGIVGDSVVEGHEGSFQISDYSFDVSALVSAVTGAGGGVAGETTFSPLTVDLDLNSGLTALLRDIASGHTISSIELQGVTSDGHTVYDLKLGHVIVTKYHDTNNGHDSLSFSYDAVSLTTTPVNSAGGPGTPVTVEWDLKTNREGGTIPDPLPNHPPTALDDAATATTGIGGTASGNVLSNDSDPDGDSLAVTAFSGTGAHGNLILNADGSYSYTVTNVIGATGGHLHDVFTYTESDGRGGTASANLDITLNRAPVATHDIAGVKIGATSVGNVLGNDADPDGDSLMVSGVGGGSVGQALAGTYGTLVLSSDGSYSYVSNKNAQLPAHGLAQDTFTYTESDGHGGTAQATLTVSIIPNGQSYWSARPGKQSPAATARESWMEPSAINISPAETAPIR
jgi:VCBS repeat-containing protein